MVRRSSITCPECGQKYVGTSARGRRRVYRYYTCARRSRYGPTGCTAPRLPADTVDALVLTALTDLYTNTDLIVDAVHAAQRRGDAARHRRREELMTVQRELDNVASALDRYLIAYENGTLDDATCSHRVQALRERATQLSSRRQQIASIADEPARPPDAAATAQIRQQLATILRAGTPAQRRTVVETHIAEVRITDGTITPVFRIPRKHDYVAR